MSSSFSVQSAFSLEPVFHDCIVAVESVRFVDAGVRIQGTYYGNVVIIQNAAAPFPSDLSVRLSDRKHAALMMSVIDGLR